jgi:hypothetical protein
MEAPQWRFTSSCEELLYLVANREFLAILIARRPLISNWRLDWSLIFGWLLSVSIGGGYYGVSE